MIKRVTIAVVCALLLHLALGWMWSVGGAIVGGYLADRKGWMVGGFGLTLAWTAIILFRFVQAPYQVSEMARVMAALLGNMPAVVTYVVTIGISAILGVAGGAVGASLAAFRRVEA